MIPDLGHQIQLGKPCGNKGIWQVVKAQLLHTPKYWGYEGSLNDEKACKKWANRETRKILTDGGYIDAETGIENASWNEKHAPSFVLVKHNGGIGVNEYNETKGTAKMGDTHEKERSTKGAKESKIEPKSAPERERREAEEDSEPTPIEKIQSTRRTGEEKGGVIQTEFGPVTKEPIVLNLKHATGTITFGLREGNLPNLNLHFRDGYEPDLSLLLNENWEERAREEAETVRKRAIQLSALPEIILIIRRCHPVEAQYLRYLFGQVVVEFEKHLGLDVFKNLDDIMQEARRRYTISGFTKP